MVPGKDGISIVIPAYNEAQMIEATLGSYLSAFRKGFSRYEFIVVCNNCSDKTPEIAGHIAKKDRHVVFINFPYYTGKGGAVIEGFKKAKFGLVGFVDADNSTNPRQFAKLVKGIEKSDVAIASRSLPGSILKPAQPFSRRLLGKCFSAIVEALFGLGIKDTQCGAKLFRKRVIDEILPELKAGGFEFDVELLWKAKERGFSIKEVAVEWSDSGKSSVGASAPLKMFLGLFKLRFCK